MDSSLTQRAEKAPESYTVEHVKYIDGFVKWYQGFKEKFPLEDMSATTVDILLLDLSAIVRIYQELRNSRELSSAKTNAFAGWSNGKTQG